MLTTNNSSRTSGVGQVSAFASSGLHASMSTPSQDRNASPSQPKNSAPTSRTGQEATCKRKEPGTSQTAESPGPPKCAKCQKALSPVTNNVLFEGRFFHQECFTCDHCYAPLETEYMLRGGKPHCETCFVQLMNPAVSESTASTEAYASSPTSDAGRSGVKLVTHPAKFQIANYNIHPPPALSMETLTEAHTVYAELVEVSSQCVVNGGFQSGDVRVLRPGQPTVYFTGLKLAKMGPIKTELHYRSSRQLHSDFVLRFRVGKHYVFSTPFRLLSSCSQLPSNVRGSVRPFNKKAPKKKKGEKWSGGEDDSDDEIDEEDMPDIRVAEAISMSDVKAEQQLSALPVTMSLGAGVAAGIPAGLQIPEAITVQHNLNVNPPPRSYEQQSLDRTLCEVCLMLAGLGEEAKLRGELEVAIMTGDEATAAAKASQLARLRSPRAVRNAGVPPTSNAVPSPPLTYANLDPNLASALRALPGLAAPQPQFTGPQIGGPQSMFRLPSIDMLSSLPGQPK